MSAQKPQARGLLGALFAFVGMSAVAGLLVTAAVTPAIAVTGMAANDSIGVFEGLPEYLQIDQLAQPTTIYAKKGAQDVALATFYAQNRLPVTFDKISQAAKDAAIAGEDPRFYSHGGVDVQGTIRGVLSTVVGHDVQGGSSITQQYVKNVLLQKCEAKSVKTKEDKVAYQTCVDDSTGVSPDRKVKEMKYAIGIEKKYSKDTILAGYLNIAGFGGSVYGIEAAARYYFGVKAIQLTPAQAASLVAMVNEPTSLKIDMPDSKTNGKANGYKANKDRRDYILTKMYQYKKLTKAQYDLAIKTPVVPKITPSVRGCQTAAGAAYFCDYVQRIILNDPSFGATQDDRASNFNRGGYKIYTTLDMDLQATAENAIHSRVPKVSTNANLGSSAVGVQPGTGRVLFMAQSRDFSQDPEVLAKNPGATAVNWNTDYAYGGSTGFSVGSTYKAFTLAEWLKQGHSLYETVNANIRTYDQSSFPNTCPTQYGGPYKPTNDSGGEEGIRSAIEATELSINTAFVAMAHQLDLCEIMKTAQAFDVHRADGKPLGENPSSVLGTNEVAPLTMATAYAAVANKGVACTPVAIDRILDAEGKAKAVPKSTCKSAVSPEVAAAMAFALKRVVTSGTASSSALGDGIDVLGKTGTSEDNEQLWLVESSTKVAAASWTGNIDGHVSLRSFYESGMLASTLRNPIIQDIMRTANGKYGGDDFPQPGSTLLRGIQVTIPDLAGKSPAEAKTTLNGLGLEFADGGQRDGVQPAGTVAISDPAAGSSVSKGAIVTVYTSNGALVALPDVVGKKASDAQAALAGFDVSFSGEGNGDSIVKSMSPAAGTAVKKGSKVKLTLKAADSTPSPGPKK
ncbi:transglycosylase domain-containing protein [Leifsonia poae]|uniref:Carboxypeptidase n=1 Tax=Leifsonia poae TaxID=110933 RepID=A0A9W6M0I6_9MICO|nr:transglycosylase domain-containing protein [Leifsonia poae]GLJ76772.1 carboxypeptidase [Leifsonia poae]